MTTEEKCLAIVKAIIDLVGQPEKKWQETSWREPVTINGVTVDDVPTNNWRVPEGVPVVGFGPDWGGNSMTVYWGDTHTHIGLPECTLEQLINQMYNLMCEGGGLSWEPTPKPAEE